LACVLTKEEFEARCAKLIEKLEAPITQCLREAGLKVGPGRAVADHDLGAGQVELQERVDVLLDGDPRHAQENRSRQAQGALPPAAEILNGDAALPLHQAVEALRGKFDGSPEKVINLMSFIAEEVREILARLGFRSLDDVIGRTELLRQVSRGAEHLDDLDLNPVLAKVDAPDHMRRWGLGNGRNPVPDSLDAEMIRDAGHLFEGGEKMQLAYTVRNTHRAVGTRLSGEITRRFGVMAMPTMLVFDHGELVHRIVGAKGKGQLLQELAVVL
jgi:hypothetical protein